MSVVEILRVNPIACNHKLFSRILTNKKYENYSYKYFEQAVPFSYVAVTDKMIIGAICIRHSSLSEEKLSLDDTHIANIELAGNPAGDLINVIDVVFTDDCLYSTYYDLIRTAILDKSDRLIVFKYTESPGATLVNALKNNKFKKSSLKPNGEVFIRYPENTTKTVNIDDMLLHSKLPKMIDRYYV